MPTVPCDRDVVHLLVCGAELVLEHGRNLLAVGRLPKRVLEERGTLDARTCPCQAVRNPGCCVRPASMQVHDGSDEDYADDNHLAHVV